MLIVDLCGTLVRENTTHGFLHSLPLVPWRKVVVQAALSRVGGAICSRIGVDARGAILVPALRGLSRDFLYDCGEKYVREVLNRRGNRAVLDSVIAARDVGTKVILATASLDPIAAAFANALHLDGVVSTQLAYGENGRCLGHIARDTTGTKLKYVRDLVGDIDRRQFEVYTDNPEDTDLMQAAHKVYFIGDVAALGDRSAAFRDRITFLQPTG